MLPTNCNNLNSICILLAKDVGNSVMYVCVCASFFLLLVCYFYKHSFVRFLPVLVFCFKFSFYFSAAGFCSPHCCCCCCCLLHSKRRLCTQFSSFFSNVVKTSLLVVGSGLLNCILNFVLFMTAACGALSRLSPLMLLLLLEVFFFMGFCLSRTLKADCLLHQ